MSSLHMIQLSPDMLRLKRLAYERRWVEGRDGDLGYAVHATLAECFGKGAMEPFRLLDRGRTPTLVAYSHEDEKALAVRAAGTGEPSTLKALNVLSIEGKRMPLETYQVGRRFGFDVRARPISRTPVAKENGKTRSRERDVFLTALEHTPEPERALLERGVVYHAWLERALGSAAKIESVTLSAVVRTVVSRPQRRSDSGTILKSVEGPDVVFKGVLSIDTSQDFVALLARGIGRHSAFGFGMLLLRQPPAA
jgi:CRISPR system Cascade subunit CasE